MGQNAMVLPQFPISRLVGPTLAPEALNAEDPTGHYLEKRLGICCESIGKSERKFQISL
jgi:hypothetical protein